MRIDGGIGMRHSIWVMIIAAMVFVSKGDCLMSDESIEFWAAHSSTKVGQADARPESAASSLSIAAARGEYEAAQLVLSASKPLRGVRVCTGHLRRRRIGSISNRNIEVRYACYVPMPVHGRSAPDPLPLLDQIDVEPGKNLPIFVIVRVPRNARAGIYTAPVQIEWEGGKTQTTLTLTVWDFSLPKKPSCVTAFGYIKDLIAQAHGLEMQSARAQELAAKYCAMMLDYGLSPFHIPAPYSSRETRRFLEDPRLTSFVIEYSENDDELAETIRLLKDRGWWSKGYFYIQDEPCNEEQYQRLRQTSQRVKSFAPDARIVSPFFRRPEFDETKSIFDLAADDVNIWCISSHHYDLDPVVREQYHKMKNRGDTLWWYVCCGPGSPYCNFFVEMSGMQHRMLFWQQKMNHVEGLLYWCTTYWNSDPSQGTGNDPWTDMATVKFINPNIYGDGSLFYPGNKVGFDGPVLSQRMLIIRDGIEDFEYLTILQERRGDRKAEEMISRLVTSMTEYCQAPEQLEQIRSEIAHDIEGK